MDTQYWLVFGAHSEEYHNNGHIPGVVRHFVNLRVPEYADKNVNHEGDFNNLDFLKVLYLKFHGKFSKIYFDWSVVKFVNWKIEHLTCVVLMLAPGGTLCIPDVKPFTQEEIDQGRRDVRNYFDNDPNVKKFHEPPPIETEYGYVVYGHGMIIPAVPITRHKLMLEPKALEKQILEVVGVKTEIAFHKDEPGYPRIDYGSREGNREFSITMFAIIKNMTKG